MNSTPDNRDILISGASVGGPVLAYWLKRYGFRPTVVELAPSPRKTGGHAVDLFGPAVDIADRMGILNEVMRLRTGNERIAMSYGDGTKTINVDVGKLAGFISDKHVEIMRDDLTELFFDATEDVEYIFDDSIQKLDQTDDGVNVTFSSGASRRFDLVIGADGLHSNVRRLAFGPEADYTRFIGAYLAVYSLPNTAATDGAVNMYMAPGRLAAFYPVRDSDEMRAIFTFCTETELDYHYRDTERQRRLVRENFSDVGWHVPQLLAGLDHAHPFYFDSITQVHMDSWTSGRVTLVGDAGYSPGPAVGGGTSLAMLGAYQLSGHLAAAGGDYRRGFAAYEDAIRPQVHNARKYGRAGVAKLAPNAPGKVWATVQAARLFRFVPKTLLRRMAQQRPSTGPILNRPLPRFTGTVTSLAADTGHKVQLRDTEVEAPMPTTPETVTQWMAAGQRLDARAATMATAEDVELVSPITDRFVFRGRQQLETLLSVAFEFLESLRYTDVMLGENSAALFYEGRIGDVALGEAQRLHLDRDGHIDRITLYVRPLPALTRLMRLLGPELARRNGKVTLSRAVRLPSAMIDGMVATGERRIMPKAAP